MNSKIKTAMIMCLFALTPLISCNEDDDDVNLNTGSQVENNVKDGTWRLTQFVDSDKDATAHFTGYSFTFKSSGILTASNGTNTFEGTWSISESDSNDDSKDDLDFNINFNLMNDFEDLNDDWDILSQSSSRIELIDISGGNGGTDYLTFEKN